MYVDSEERRLFFGSGNTYGKVTVISKLLARTPHPLLKGQDLQTDIDMHLPQHTLVLHMVCSPTYATPQTLSFLTTGR